MSGAHKFCDTCGGHDPLCRRCANDPGFRPRQASEFCQCEDKRQLSNNPGGIPKRGWGKKKK